MKKMKSLMLLIATMLILTVAFCMNASAAEWLDLGESHQYTFDNETGVMVIKGEGEISSAFFGIDCPDHYKGDFWGCNCEPDRIGPFKEDYIYDEYPERLEAYRAAVRTKTLIVQEGTTSLATSAFYIFSNLEVAILPQSLTEISAGAFYRLSKLNTVVLSNSIVSIGESAFSGCENLKNIYMADTLKAVGKDAFYGCDKEVIRIPDSATVEDGNLIAPVDNLTAMEKKLAVTLSWEKSATAEGYTVKCNDIGKTVTTKDTSCTIKVDTPSKYYTFVVTPYIIRNGKTVYGEEADVMIFAKPEAPKVSASPMSSDNISICWEDHNDNCDYAIYEQLDDGSWKLIAITERSSYYVRVTSGTKHTYAVRPYHEDIYGTVLGDYTIVTAATTPATVTAKATSPSKGKITLTWNGVSGDIDGYRVYYKLGNGAYKIYKNYATPQNLTFTNLKSGSKYTFAVRAGIKTSGGIVWSGYKEVPVTVK